MLAKTAGVKHLIVLVNKMDDPTVNWSLERSVNGHLYTEVAVVVYYLVYFNFFNKKYLHVGTKNVRRNLFHF